jgi:hypothetical protein
LQRLVANSLASWRPAQGLCWAQKWVAAELLELGEQFRHDVQVVGWH